MAWTRAQTRARERAAARRNAPCTRTTARCTNARDYRCELRPCCRGHVIGIMRVLVDVLNESGATWWADYGTLLGAVRNPLTTWADYPWLPQAGRTTAGPAPGIIPHDKDGDLGILFSDWDKVMKMRRALVRPGFYAPPSSRWATMKVRVSHRNHTNVDLFFWRESDGTARVNRFGETVTVPAGHLYRERYAVVDRCKGKEFPRAALSPVTTVQWEGLTLPAPADPAAFLAMRYGPEWMRPVMANHDGVKRP